MPKKVLDMVRRDNSGISPKPLPGSSIPENERYFFLNHKATHDVVGRSGLATLNKVFELNLSNWIQQVDIGPEWVEFEDLYIFMRDMLFQTSTDAFCGPRLLQNSPDLGKHI